MRCNARPAALRSFNSPLQSSLTSTLLPFLYQTRTLHYGATLVTRYRETGGNRTLRPSLQAISQCGSRSYAARSIEHDPAPRPRTKGNVPSDKFRNLEAKPPRTDRSTTNIPFRGHELRSRKARPSRIDHTASIPFRDHEHRSHKAKPSSEDFADNIYFDKHEYRPQRAKPSPEDLADDMLFDKYEYESQGGKLFASTYPADTATNDFKDHPKEATPSPEDLADDDLFEKYELQPQRAKHFQSHYHVKDVPFDNVKSRSRRQDLSEDFEQDLPKAIEPEEHPGPRTVTLTASEKKVFERIFKSLEKENVAAAQESNPEKNPETTNSPNKHEIPVLAPLAEHFDRLIVTYEKDSPSNSHIRPTIRLSPEIRNSGGTTENTPAPLTREEISQASTSIVSSHLSAVEAAPTDAAIWSLLKSNVFPLIKAFLPPNSSNKTPSSLSSDDQPSKPAPRAERRKHLQHKNKNPNSKTTFYSEGVDR